ncbi:MAG: FAD-binding oxidoreductase, partial [Pseudomonadota bacterium]
MPKVTEKVSKAAYNALQNIVGPEWVTDDVAITESYVKGGEIHDCIYQRGQQPPGVVVMPNNTEEVQKIVKVCMRYHLPYTPIGAFWGVHCGGKVPFHVSIDLSRMRSLEWDEKHMVAIVGPGQIHSPLQAEAQERGLYTMTPGGGSQAAVIGNMLTCNYSPLNYRLGLATRRILGVEWVLPNGELIRLGSLATSDDPYWGEGPGPDLRGLLRGYLGWWGKVGIITKMAIKMHPLFLPERMKPVERGMLSTLEFPDNRIKWYNFRMPSEDAMRDAMREISRCEIGAAVMRVPTIWRYRGKSRSREDFWSKWGPDEKKIRDSRATSSVCRVLLIGYTSAEQLQYEESVLMGIMDEVGGEL